MTVLSSEARATSRARVLTNWLASPIFFWMALALYLVAHVALRLWETPNLGKNDVQEALAAQGWAWGYHPRNPPLHTWLVMVSYAVFGVSLVAHVVLKYVLLGAAYLFAYLSARRLLAASGLAAVSAFSLSLLMPFTWTVHTALTHTLLLAVMIFATLLAAIRLTMHQRWQDYVLFGAAIGFGLLAKYSYPLFLIPLIAAMLAQAEFRRVLLVPKSLLTIATATVLFVPHGVWMLSARFDFIQFLAAKQQSVAPDSYLFAVGRGLVHLAVGALTFAGLLIILSLLFFGKLARSIPARSPPWGRVLFVMPAFGLGLLVLDVILFRAAQFEERYLMCALLMTPLAVFAWVDQRAGGLGRRTLTNFAAAILTVVLIVFAGLGGRALLYNEHCNRCWDEMASQELAHQMRAASGFRGGTIVADHYNVAGNMSLAFPAARVVAANYLIEQPERDADGQCLLVWNARNAGDALPRSLADYLAQHHVMSPSGEPVYVNAPLLRSDRRLDRFAYWLLPNADGNCEPR